MTSPGNWITVSESKYPWERDALDFVRQSFPSHEPYRAWSNFEFIADDGSINEVDLLVFTPQGFFLIEIKSRPGRLRGDAGTWTWESEGKRYTDDNPLFSANLKSKKLSSLLARQKACQRKGRLPFLETLIFCSAPDQQCDLQGNAAMRVCLRDREAEGSRSARPGILAAIMRRDCPGLDPAPKGTHDRPMGKVVSQAMDQIGVRPSQRHRKVGDYVLEQLVGEGPGFQDWQASHTQVAESKRRVRLYLVRAGATPEDRDIIHRAGLREFRILENLAHPGILRVQSFTKHEAGSALVFEHDPHSIRLDHFLTQQNEVLNIATRLDLVRQIAEVIRYAHEKKIVHRALSPQSILVAASQTDRPKIKVFNWQSGYRDPSTSSGDSAAVTATLHIDRLVEDSSTAYMAPEAFSDDNLGEYLDVFSLGTVAFHILSGVRPATNGLDLSNQLRNTKGLQISSVLNGAGEWLVHLIQEATHPIVSYRTDSVSDFLENLEQVENELTTPDQETVDDPDRAKQGDILPGGFQVLRPIGKGAYSVVLLVRYHGTEHVLKVASGSEHNSRLTDEAHVLQKLHHAHIVVFEELVDVGSRVGFLMQPVFSNKEQQTIETLGHRLRTDGRFHIDMLQRFGEDLLGVVNYLEEQGIPHRDIKPDNIAIGMVGSGSKLHLVLFDFSLSRTPLDNIRAGTTAYLDPLLPIRESPRWDLHAERYAAAMTLYELATATLPKWGDGTTDPSHLDASTEITIDSELFDADLREPLTEFFQQAFRRNIEARFDNAEEMLEAWRDCFKAISRPGALSDSADESQFRELLAEATFDTHIPELGLGTRATNALDRANIFTVEDLLTASVYQLMRLRGVGNKTRREITSAVRILRDRLGTPSRQPGFGGSTFELEAESPDAGNLSVDSLVARLIRASKRQKESVQRVIDALLSLDPAVADLWPTQSRVAEVANLTRARVGQILGDQQKRWSKDSAITRLRGQVGEILAAQAGVMSVAELAEAILLSRGSSQEEPKRSQLARAVLRVAVEVERSMVEPRFLVRREQARVLIASSNELATYAFRLGQIADRIAAEDPLLAPERVQERLREVEAPKGTVVPEARLIRLAAAASDHAAVSSRQELYPKAMPAARALKLSPGALSGAGKLTVEQIRERVASRYPQAEPLPDRPMLDQLLQEAGANLQWSAGAEGETGHYISLRGGRESITSASTFSVRVPTGEGWREAGQITPEEADARQFEERLQRAIQEGSFLALLVSPRDYDRARREIVRRFPVHELDFEALLIDALQEVANGAKVAWQRVVQTDATPNAGDWDKLILLIKRAMPKVEQKLLATDQTMLVLYPGLLARYDQMDLLSRLSQKVGRRDGIPGFWLLVPNAQHAMLDGKPVPLIGPGQRAKVPESWLANVHRASGFGSD